MDCDDLDDRRRRYEAEGIVEEDAADPAMGRVCIFHLAKSALDVRRFGGAVLTISFEKDGSWLLIRIPPKAPPDDAKRNQLNEKLHFLRLKN
jgi:hypothetical protein